MSFSLYLLNILWQERGELEKGLHVLPASVDIKIAILKLESLAVKIQQLTPQMVEYMNSWRTGT